MKTRVLVAIPITVVVLLAIFVQGWVLTAFAAFVGIMASWEFSRALKKRIFTPLVIGVAIIFALLFAMDYALSLSVGNSMAFLNTDTALEVLVLAVIGSFLVAFAYPKDGFDALKNTLLALVYPGLFAVFLYLLVLCLRRGATTPQGAYVLVLSGLLLLFVPPMLSDTLAYLWGRKFGKRKLCPEISPNKTVAGSVAGIAGGAAGGAIVRAVLLAFHAVPEAGFAAYILMGAVLAVLSQCGDLAASYVKRAAGIKDFGRLFPGHGGVLDRFDSTLFVAPVVYLFVRAGLTAVL